MSEGLNASMERVLELFQGNRYLEALAIVVAAVVLAKLVDLIVTKVLLGLTRRSQTDFDDQLVKLLHKPVFLTVLLIGLGLAVSRLELGDTPQLLTFRILKTAAILIYWGFLAKAARLVLEVMSNLESRFAFIESRTVALLDNTAKIVIGTGSIYAILVTWSIDVGGFLLSAGVLGLALGLAAKDTLANLFSGIFIIADAPYQKGDFINLDSGERGMVTNIGLRSTRLLTRDDIEVTVPNAVIANAKIINESGGRWLRERIRIKVGVAYGSDIDQIEAILLDIAAKHSSVCDDPEPRVRFRGFGDSALDIELLAWIGEPVLRGKVLHELNCQVYKRFGAEGVQIPFPQRDVHVHYAAGTSPGTS